MTNNIVVLVTCGSATEARHIARTLVDRRLAACVNVLSVPVASIYRWKGATKTAKEFLLIIKSSKARFGALQKTIKRVHSYEVPEIIALPIVRGSSSYLAWLSESVRAPRPASSRG